jgi:hypothetical protein
MVGQTYVLQSRDAKGHVYEPRNPRGEVSFCRTVTLVRRSGKEFRSPSNTSITYLNELSFTNQGMK